MKNRLDLELVKRNMVPSRAKAQELIKGKYVICDGKVINKNNYLVTNETVIEVKKNDKLRYVSRGGLKLEKAINTFKIDFTNLTVMDIGSSTGGFCDCALKHGAKKIIAIDVGTDLLHKSLRDDKRIELYEKTNFKDLDRKIFDNIDIITCDVSFISLRHIIKKISEQNIKIGIIALIKPQFECGKEIATKYKGVILDESIHKKIVKELEMYFNSLGFIIDNFTVSPIKGGDGNVEYLAYITNNNGTYNNTNYNKEIEKVFKSIK